MSKILVIGALALASHTFGQSGVSIDVEQFGVGSACRPGDVAAIRLKLTSNLKDPTAVWVQWEMPNVDGDIAECGRSLTLTPNMTALTWLYAFLPPDTTNASIWTVRAFEERDGVRRGEIGATRISAASASQLVEPTTSMIAVVGDKTMGLDGYRNRGALQWPVGAHEDTRIAGGIRPTQLPDRWFGLMEFDAVVWGGGDDKSSPQDLGVDQAEALREYVRRGGHLVIVLPTANDSWGLGAIGKTQLEEFLPCRAPGITPRRDEAVPLLDLLSIMSKYNTLGGVVVGNRPPPEFTIRVFKDLRGTFNVIDNHYEPFMALPDGRVIAVQRLFGHGRVTVIGIDVADGRFAGLGQGLPQADAFWNRILGRRSDAPSATELNDMDQQKKLARTSNSMPENRMGSGQLITGATNLQAEAAAGLLLAFILFVLYWVIAGPGGYYVLKHYGYARHAWVAFAGCAAAFAVLAWVSLGALPSPLKVRHITFLDHVARSVDDPRSEEPQYQHAISFFSVYLPNYGNTPVAIASVPEQRDLLLSWIQPGAPPLRFPNVSRYRVDVARSSASFALPARSTATQLYADWMGGLDAKWGGMLRVDLADPIRVVKIGDEESLRGRIINELPGTLSDFTLIWVKSNRYARPRYIRENGRDQPWVAATASGMPLNSTSIWRANAADPWTPGKPLDLAAIISTQGDNLVNWIGKRFVSRFNSDSRSPGLGGNLFREDDRMYYLEMMSIFQELNPPSYIKTGSQDPDVMAFRRELGRNLDLSPWFTRPCVIVMGYLQNSEIPVPLRISEQDMQKSSDGLTMVRWVYPLPLDEKVAFKEVFEAK